MPSVCCQSRAKDFIQKIVKMLTEMFILPGHPYQDPFDLANQVLYHRGTKILQPSLDHDHAQDQQRMSILPCFSVSRGPLYYPDLQYELLPL